jgi:hypothetical protein
MEMDRRHKELMSRGRRLTTHRYHPTNTGVHDVP